MPICPRCGKSLSSEQALTYHLNKKYKCGSWECQKCNKNFDTKFDKNIHEMNCVTEKTCLSYEYLMDIYKKLESMELGKQNELELKNKIVNITISS